MFSDTEQQILHSSGKGVFKGLWWLGFEGFVLGLLVVLDLLTVTCSSV